MVAVTVKTNGPPLQPSQRYKRRTAKRRFRAPRIAVTNYGHVTPEKYFPSRSLHGSSWRSFAKYFALAGWRPLVGVFIATFCSWVTTSCRKVLLRTFCAKASSCSLKRFYQFRSLSLCSRNLPSRSIRFDICASHLEPANNGRGAVIRAKSFERAVFLPRRNEGIHQRTQREILVA